MTNGRKIIPMGRNEKDDDFAVGYMCLTDFECEIGIALGGNTIYPDIDDLKANRKCVDQCGVVEVEVRARRIIQEPREE